MAPMGALGVANVIRTQKSFAAIKIRDDYMKVGEVQEVWCKKLRVASDKRLFVLKRAAVAAHGSVEEGNVWQTPCGVCHTLLRTPMPINAILMAPVPENTLLRAPMPGNAILMAPVPGNTLLKALCQEMHYL